MDPLWIVGAAAIVGVFRSHEMHNPRYLETIRIGEENSARILALVFIAAIALFEASSFKGFIYILFAPIGAYKVARVLSESWFATQAQGPGNAE